MATNLISGLASGIDWKNMVDQLISVEHRRVDLITNKQTSEQAKLTEWQSLNTKLLALKTAAGNLKDPDAFNVYTALMTTDSSTVPAADLLAVTTSTSAAGGSYSLKINNVAVANKLSSGTFSSTSTELGAGFAGDLLLNGVTLTVAATDTLATLRDKFNSANVGATPTGVTASIISYSATDNRLILASDTTGAAGITLVNGGAPDIVTALGISQLVAGADASLTVEGVAVTRTTNVIDDVLSGVTLDLLKADPARTISLTVGRDTDAIMAKLNAFVTSYNSVSAYIQTQTSYDSTKNTTSGILFGDGTLASVKSDLTSLLTQPVAGVAADYATLGLVGISVDRYGQLTVDETKVTGYLKTNFNDLSQLSAGVGELFDQALFNITDTFEGYATFKQQSLQTKISGYGTQIDEMEARLERKRETLTNQYVAMETALQKIQSQSAWLTAQTQAAVNGWYRGSSG